MIAVPVAALGVGGVWGHRAGKAVEHHSDPERHSQALSSGSGAAFWLGMTGAAGAGVAGLSSLGSSMDAAETAGSGARSERLFSNARVSGVIAAAALGVALVGAGFFVGEYSGEYDWRQRLAGREPEPAISWRWNS